MADTSMDTADLKAFAAFVERYSHSPTPEVLRNWQEHRPKCAHEMAEYAAILAQAAEAGRGMDPSPNGSATEVALLASFERLAAQFRRLASDAPGA